MDTMALHEPRIVAASIPSEKERALVERAWDAQALTE